MPSTNISASAAPLHTEQGLQALQPAKLIQPYLPAVQIQRQGLIDSLCSSRAPRVSLIRAPAGFGKSTLMQQAYIRLQQANVATAWLTLDAADNDVPRLLHFLNKSLEQVDGQPWQFEEGLSAGQMALELMDQLSSLRTPSVLFLDDLEALQNPVTLSLIRQLIDRLPPGARLVLGSRAIPDIGLTRLRTSGQLQELDSSRLRFSQSESVSLLKEKCSLTLPADVMSHLQLITEGWPAAVWLVSMLLEDAEDPVGIVSNFSGSSALVADYLSEEVLARQSPDLCNFMLRTSILPQLNAELCDAILGIDNSRDLLNKLEQSNLFLVPLDQERKWFRYHSLFSCFLQEQLASRHPKALTQLHRCAAEWYLQQQRPVPAIEQALQSGDMEYALPLFSRHAQRLLGEGRAQLLARLLSCVPDDALQNWPDLQVVHVWAIAFTRGAADAMNLLSDYENRDAPSDLLLLNAIALKPMLLSMLDRHEDSFRQAQFELEGLSTEHVFPHAILRTSLSYVTLVMGDYAEAQSLLDEGRRLNVIDRSPFTHIYAQSVEGVIELLQGHLRQATSRFRLAAGERKGAGRFATNGNAMAAILLAETLYEAGEYSDCERLLQVYVPLMQQQGVPDHLICGHRNLTRIYAARGDVDDALQTINELEYYGQRNGLPRLVACAHLERARLYTLAGDKQASNEELQRAETLADWSTLDGWYLFGTDTEYLSLAQWRWQIHFGKAIETIESLDNAIKAANDERRHRRALKLGILKTMALYQADKESEALIELQALIRTANNEQSVQLLLDEGEIVHDMMKRMASLQQWHLEPDLLQQPSNVFDRLLSTAIDKQMFNNSDSPGSSQLVEKLTKKEFIALQLLAEGLSNNAISERLFVSESTVRTHLRNINAKLHSKNRTEAVAIARRLGLLG